MGIVVSGTNEDMIFLFSRERDEKMASYSASVLRGFSC